MMGTAAWDELLGAQDRETLARAGFARRVGFGRRPALLVIDAQRYMVGAAGEDQQWPASCGETGRTALEAIIRLVQAARGANIPRFFSRFVLARDGSDVGVYALKRGMLASEHWCLAGSKGAELADGLEPGPDAVVFAKTKPSAFHGTALIGHLVARNIDTLIVAGGATSNCVQASVFDAASYNLRVIVPEEAVFDRFPVSHAAALFDMDRQFADVMKLEDVVERLSRGFADD